MSEVVKQTVSGKRKKWRNQNGFTLAELAIVLMIGALIVAAAMIVVPRVLANIRAGKITSALSTAIPAIQTAYQNQTSFNNLTTAQVAQNGWMGTSFTEYNGGSPTGNLLTQWGTITFAPINGGTTGQGTFTNIPTKECQNIAQEFTNDMYLTASVNGTAIKAGVNNVDLTASGTQCSSTSTNTIVFTFGRA
ncbi:type 4 pilus major pilin [Ralstonia insidiosa]|uniref:Prepilin-type N-terminal cleavage/methylation domain-containing protein n=1 Tax=Ralstonia insidiosa TaxID=190721 RepID=A0A848P2Y5_9RALS|nr:type 4 pilus major pilin [Ralstonia insidiosa]NMV39899.1 prepilin-type N-terminal cleavage/methylation domain-containing protein [Ralstonia insidiosa]